MLLHYFSGTNSPFTNDLDLLFLVRQLKIWHPHRNNVEKMEALENLDLIFLCLDEMVDQGYASVLFYNFTTMLTS